MKHSKKLQQLLFSNDIESIKQGIHLLDALCDTIEEIYIILEKSVPDSKQTWQQQFVYDNKKPNPQYLNLWLLVKMAEERISWTLELKELSLYVNPPENMQSLQHIKRINIFGDTVELSVLSSFSNMTTLDIECNMNLNNIVLADYSFSQKIESLSIYGNDHLQRIDVQNCPSLRNLFVMECYNLQVLIGLSELTELQHLSLTYIESPSFDFSFLLQLINLQGICVFNCEKFEDLTLLKNMKQLEYLDLDGTMVQDLSPISELPKLKKLNIIGCYEIRNLSPLHKHPSLEQLIVFKDGLMQHIPEEFIKLQRERPDIRIEEE
jgi:hypothetical protein